MAQIKRAPYENQSMQNEIFKYIEVGEGTQAITIRFPMDTSRRFQLGKGSYGVVYRGELSSEIDREKHSFAVKEIPFKRSSDDNNIKKNIAILQQISHNNVVTFIGACFEKDRCYLVFERMGSNLHAWLEKRKKDPLMRSDMDLLKDLTKQLIDALNYLHTNHVIHRDIKPSNILRHIDEEKYPNRVLIADMDSCITSRSSLIRQTMGTRQYMAPEMIKGLSIDTKADMWSFACTVLEIATSEVPYGNLSGSAIIEGIANGDRQPIINPYISTHLPWMDELLKSCFVAEPTRRASAEKLLNEYFPSVGAESSTVVLPRRFNSSLSTTLSYLCPAKETETHSHTFRDIEFANIGLEGPRILENMIVPNGL